tara:strand:+ start:480 stop:1148 length:669 start_codon:yes stop_codon:yes gene_type:complete
MKKTNNQEYLKQMMDEGDYAPLYPDIVRSDLTDLQKLVVSLMCNDINMNGSITWKQQTYADKLGKSRQSIYKNFKWLEENGMLIANTNNKAGGKSNTYTLSFSTILDYKTCKPEATTCKPKVQVPPVNLETQPVNIETQPVNLEPLPVNLETQSVVEGLHIKKPKETNKENNKESKEEDYDNDSFFGYNKIKNSNQEYLESRTKELVTANHDLTDFFNDIDI